jgi:hypothetical protein
LRSCRPSLFDESTVLDGVNGALASLGGSAAIDAACAPCFCVAFSDGRAVRAPSSGTAEVVHESKVMAAVLIHP